MPTPVVASSLSLSDRVTSVEQPKSEKRAPAFAAVLMTTFWFPRSTRTSVTSSLRRARWEIASSDPALGFRPHNQRFVVKALGRRNTGPATSIESSRASVLVTLGGDLSVAANVSPNVTRAE